MTSCMYTVVLCWTVFLTGAINFLESPLPGNLTVTTQLLFQVFMLSCGVIFNVWACMRKCWTIPLMKMNWKLGLRETHTEKTSVSPSSPGLWLCHSRESQSALSPLRCVKQADMFAHAALTMYRASDILSRKPRQTCIIGSSKSGGENVGESSQVLCHKSSQQSQRK